MNSENHFLEGRKLVKLTNKRMDKEVVKNIQLLSEKFLLDIITRASLLCRHKGKSVLDTSEISFVVEKDFDYSFGTREIINTNPNPSNEHIEKMAELSRQNK